MSHHFKPSYENRVLSVIHCWFIKGFVLGNIRINSDPLVSILIFEHIPSKTSIDSTLVNSQGLTVKAYGLDVNAPTGHKSITFPDNSDSNNFEIYVPTSIFLPRPDVP